MRTTLALLLSLIIVLPVSAHHSVSAFFDQSTTVELEGTIKDVFWRNPHVGLTLEVVNAAGETEEWELEGGAMNTLLRQGFSAESVSVGDRVRVAGAPSRRGDLAMFINNFLLPNGEEVIFSDLNVPLRWTSPTADDTASAGADASGSGFFKVWGQREFNRLRAPLALTPRAQAASDAFDRRTDDLGLRCIPPGMPNSVLNPYPMELIDEGDRIVQRIEEWDARRVIHMTDNPPAPTQAPDRLGYSVGRFEGNVLIIETTRIDFPLLDGDGTPMSADVEILERYTLSEDENRLAYEIIATDPQNLTEPAIWEGAWLYRPGVQVRPYECTLPDRINRIYQ